MEPDLYLVLQEKGLMEGRGKKDVAPEEYTILKKAQEPSLRVATFEEVIKYCLMDRDKFTPPQHECADKIEHMLKTQNGAQYIFKIRTLDENEQEHEGYRLLEEVITDRVVSKQCRSTAGTSTLIDQLDMKTYIISPVGGG